MARSTAASDRMYGVKGVMNMAGPASPRYLAALRRPRRLRCHDQDTGTNGSGRRSSAQSRQGTQVRAEDRECLNRRALALPGLTFIALFSRSYAEPTNGFGRINKKRLLSRGPGRWCGPYRAAGPCCRQGWPGMCRQSAAAGHGDVMCPVHPDRRPPRHSSGSGPFCNVWTAGSCVRAEGRLPVRPQSSPPPPRPIAPARPGTCAARPPRAPTPREAAWVP